MNRRSLLKLLGITPAAVVTTPPDVLTTAGIPLGAPANRYQGAAGVYDDTEGVQEEIDRLRGYLAEPRDREREIIFRARRDRWDADLTAYKSFARHSKDRIQQERDWAQSHERNQYEWHRQIMALLKRL